MKREASAVFEPTNSGAAPATVGESDGSFRHCIQVIREGDPSDVESLASPETGLMLIRTTAAGGVSVLYTPIPCCARIRLLG